MTKREYDSELYPPDEALGFSRKLLRALKSDFGGLTQNELPSVSYSWFQEKDLLKGLVTGPFKGNIEAALEAAVRSSPMKDKADKFDQTPLQQLENPEFFSSLETDLSSFQGDMNFSKFMTTFSPPTNMELHLSDEGKYNQLYRDLYRFFFSTPRESLTGDRLTTREKIAETVFISAPPHVRNMLIERFPKDFGHFKMEFHQNVDEVISVWEKEGLLTGILTPVLKYATLLHPDRQEIVTKGLASYIYPHLPPSLQTKEKLKYFLQQFISYKQSETSPKIPEVDLNALLTDFIRLPKLLEEAQFSNEPIAQELLDNIENGIVVPTTISALYKPVSSFWNLNFEENDSRENAVSSLDRFIVNFFEKKLNDFPEGQELKNYFRQRIFPNVRYYFGDIASFYQEIDYVSEKDHFGKPKYLYLHQVEAIKRLVEQQRGILADEPGTGKTIMLALASLNLIERKGEKKDNPGRLLVVGNKSTIDNWELEIAQHLNISKLDIINTNTPPHPENSKIRLAEDAKLYRRLEAFHGWLRNPNNKKQIYLVNYDLFRNERFQEILAEFGFDVMVVDEAHNVKARDVSILEDLTNGEQKDKNLAQRTEGLYRFIKDNPSMSVFFATATPFVKDISEPLIMGNLVSPELFNFDYLSYLKDRPSEVYSALREIMIRRRKVEIADLPQKETKFVSVDLTKMSDEDKEIFLKTAKTLANNTERGFPRFYSLLSLESQAKLGWLKDFAEEIKKKKKKVVIFTPFVHDKDRFTASMSTIRIANYLKKEGVERVGLLDGTLDLDTRNQVKEKFKLPMSDEESLDVIVGNYQTAGESITLCTPYNRATEVVLFVAPNSVSKLIQSVDRIHRFGQTKKVTIHIPFVTRDILGRREGTYDERIVNSLYRQLAHFESIIDGLFFVEPPDIYQTIAKDTVEQKISNYSILSPSGSVDSVFQASLPRIKWMSELKAIVNKKPKIVEKQIRNISSRKRKRQDAEDLEEELDVEELTGLEEPWVRNITAQYLQEIGSHKILTREEEFELGQKMERGNEALQLLDNGTFNPEQKQVLLDSVNEGLDANDELINSNYKLVVSRARRKMGRGLPLLDIIQEGNLGLMRATEDWDWKRGFRFSTYAVWWIDQAMGRALADQSTTIRIPVHMRETLGKVDRVSSQFTQSRGRKPTESELGELLADAGVPPWKIKLVLKTFHSGVLNLASIDEPVGEDKDSEFGDFIPDPEARGAADAERLVESQKLRKEVEDVLNDILTDREREIILSRLGEGKDVRPTLEDLGEKFGITRERIRQLEWKVRDRLSKSRRLNKTWYTYIHGEFQTVRSLESKSPEELLAGERRLYGGFEPLQDTIFSEIESRKMQKIIYRQLYINLSSQEIAQELNLTVKDVEDHFNRGRLILWEQFPSLERQYPSYLDKYVYFFPSIDPKSIAEKYNDNNGKLDTKTRKILESFFGLNGHKATYNVRETARMIDLRYSQAKRLLLEGVRKIESQ